jgi:hypothetical protein
MPLFVTVTPGTTVTSSTTLDASTLNLLGTPSVDVTGTVDGGSITLGVQSVPLPSLYAQNDQTIVGNGAGSMASPVALTTTDLVLTATTVNIKNLAVTAAKIATNTITADKLLQIDGTTPKILGRFTTAVGNIETNLSVGSNLTTSGNTLNALRPAFSETLINSTANSYLSPTVRVDAIELAVFTKSITPQTSTSKVLVTFNVSYDLSNDYLGSNCSNAFILTRVIGSGSPLELGVPSPVLSNQIYGIKTTPYSADQRNTLQTAVITFVDSPATVLACTYRLKFYGAVGSTIFINRTSNNGATSRYTCATSQVILQEILP